MCAHFMHANRPSHPDNAGTGGGGGRLAGRGRLFHYLGYVLTHEPLLVKAEVLRVCHSLHASNEQLRAYDLTAAT